MLFLLVKSRSIQVHDMGNIIKKVKVDSLYAVKGIKQREQCIKSNEAAGKGSLRVPSIKTKAGIPLSKANCICDLCESLGAKESVKMPSSSR